jgi:hypothetical protein
MQQRELSGQENTRPAPLRGRQGRLLDVPAGLFPRRFKSDYEDLRIVTSGDEHGCTSNRLIGIY